MITNNTRSIIQEFAKQYEWHGNGVFINKEVEGFYLSVSMREIDSRTCILTLVGTRDLCGKKWACECPICPTTFDSVSEFKDIIDRNIALLAKTYQLCCASYSE